MLAGYFRLIVIAAVISATVWAYSAVQNRDADGGTVLTAAQSSRTEPGKKAPEETTLSDKMENLRAVMIDLAGYQGCERIKGRYRPLSSGGSPSENKEKADTGIIRIDTCNAREIGRNHLRIDISGIGWQWISRKREQLGAKLTVDDNAKFSFRISMVGTFDLDYDQEEHILTLWFVPTQPVDVDLQVKGNVNVDTESLWSSIVGIAGSLAGKSPEQSAQKAIRKQGNRLFQSKLSRGMTLIIDLCTGQRDFKLGTFPQGQLPESATPGTSYLVNSRGILHTGSMLAAGPFDADKPLNVRFDSVEGGLRASLVCEGDAERITRAYVNNTPLPKIKPLDEKIIRPGRPGTMKIVSDPGCRAVLIMRPLSDQADPVTFNYEAYHEGAKAKALVDCSGK